MKTTLLLIDLFLCSSVSFSAKDPTCGFSVRLFKD